MNWWFNKCRRCEPALSWLAAGALDASEQAALATHLAGCPACRTKLAQLQHLTRGLTEAGRRFAEIEAPVAAALGLSVGTVKSRLHHALEKLRKMKSIVNLSNPPGDT